MTLASSIVHVIVAPDYGEKLRGLPADEAAWVADTPTNNPVIESVRTSRTTGITSFRVNSDHTPEDWLLGVLSPIEEHHGEYSQTPPYSSLHVIGTFLTPRIRARLEDYDFVKFEDLPDGFIAHRSPG